MSFCVLKFHAALAWRAELEGGLAVGVGDEEVAKYDDIHANKNIDVLKVVFHDFNIGYKIASRSKHVNKIANVGYSFLYVGIVGGFKDFSEELLAAHQPWSDGLLHAL